jgi:thymidylate synthase (FAD)
VEVKLLNSMGTDLTVVNAARVSFGKESKTLEDKDKKLIKYLAEHEHFSPFGHCFASFYVKAPIFVSRQLVKHKFLRINEVSRRYVDTEPEFWYPDTWRGRSKDKKQGSEGEAPLPDYLKHMFKVDIDNAVGTYNRMIEEGVAPEQARIILPLNTYTEWWWSGSLDAFAQMCKLRLKTDVQKETRFIAEEVSKSLEEIFPVSWGYLLKGKYND